MQITLKKIGCLLLVTTLVACQNDAEVTEKDVQVAEVNNITMQKKSLVKETASWQEVSVKYLEFEGGFYGLVSVDGQKLLPTNLKQEYRVDGTKLRVKGDILKGMMTIQQWGKSYKITEVELIKLGNSHQNKKDI